MNAPRETSGRGRGASFDTPILDPSIFSENERFTDAEAAAFFERWAAMYPAPDRVKKLEREVDSLTVASLRHLRDSIAFRLEAEAAAARLAHLRAANRGRA